MPELNHYRYDPKVAQALLKKVGYKNEQVTITFFPEYYLYGNYAAVAVADMWKKLGINVKIQQSEPAFSNADHTKVMIQPWSNPLYYADPMGVFDTHWSADSWVSKKGLWTTDLPEWKGTYEKARFSTDTNERRAAYHKLLEMGQELSGWIVLYQPYESFAMNEKISW